jgi:hypothetical protein
MFIEKISGQPFENSLQKTSIKGNVKRIPPKAVVKYFTNIITPASRILRNNVSTVTTDCLQILFPGRRI